MAISRLNVPRIWGTWSVRMNFVDVVLSAFCFASCAYGWFVLFYMDLAGDNKMGLGSLNLIISHLKF
jgi:hypothetical protein